MSVRFRDFSKVAFVLSAASLLIGVSALRSSLEWTWKLLIALVSFGLYMLVVLAENCFIEEGNRRKLKEVFNE